MINLRPPWPLGRSEREIRGGRDREENCRDKDRAGGQSNLEDFWKY